MFLSVHRIFLIFCALTSLIIGLFAFIFSLCVAEHKRSRLVGSLLSLVLLGFGSFSLAIGLGFGEKTMLNRISHYGKVEYYSSLGQSSVTNSQHIASKIYLHQCNKRYLKVISNGDAYLVKTSFTAKPMYVTYQPRILNHHATMLEKQYFNGLKKRIVRSALYNSNFKLTETYNIGKIVVYRQLK
jgi:hypothetical protein